METQQKSWNRRQSEFRELLLSFDQHQQAIAMFMEQHAALHPARRGTFDCLGPLAPGTHRGCDHEPAGRR